MDPALLKTLLGIAVLTPLASFWVILLAGRWLGKQAWFIATGAIMTAGVLSFLSLGIWLYNHFPPSVHHGAEHHAAIERVRIVPERFFHKATAHDASLRVRHQQLGMRELVDAQPATRPTCALRIVEHEVVGRDVTVDEVVGPAAEPAVRRL